MSNTNEYTETAPSVTSQVAYNVTNKETKKREFQGNKDITLFTLSEFFDDAPAYKVEYSELPEGGKEASIIYEDEKLQYLQDALTQRIKGTAAARFRAGEPADTSIQDILERAKSGGSTYLSELSACKQAIAAYLVSKGKPANAVAQLVKKLAPESLASADDKLQNTVAAILNKWQEEQPDEAGKHTAIIQRFADAMAQDDSFLDDLSID